ncbi:MAG TPA: hypothetical protein ENG63_09920 [Candidatus Desulfofervidus auxilii]|uniref:Phosphodiesterase n=1 Tax=Desulfofervidus auxilii TaxID=1621989 RepID=A0A7C0Y5M8_DESA2|nr:hypothetical protein [Candidatus Desulfofervidus auxilii]
MNKLLIIGLDGFDPDLFEKWDSGLPNLSLIKRKGFYTRLKSVFPPDSVPAWTTIYTGLSPDKHGIIHSIDYLEKNYRKLKFDFHIFKGKTFWDIAGFHEKKVCIINPFLAYPVWPVNGIMVNGPVFVSGENQSYPEDILKRYDIPPLGGIVDFPTKNTLEEFYKKTIKLTLDEARFGLRLLENVSWDLFFISFLTPDRIQHFFWRYCDKNDPTYPSSNKHENKIKEAYILFDKIVGNFLDEIDCSTTVIVLSDHGHGMRCPMCFNIKEYLRRRGFVYTKIGKSMFLNYVIEKLKFYTLNIIYHFELEISGLIKKIPGKRTLKESSYLMQPNKSLVNIPNLNGSNPYGGIELNRKLLDAKGINYEKFRENLIKELKELKTPDGEFVFEYICKREEIYNSAKYFPDILFKLNERYGVSWQLYSPLFSINPTHKKISGGHKQYGVFFAYNYDGKINNSHPTLVDIVPTILQMLDIDIGRFEGKPVISK